MAGVRFASRVTAQGVLLVVLLVCAAPASALPVTLYADRKAVSGFDPKDVAFALELGAAEPLRVSGLIGGESYFHVTTPDGIPGVKGKSRKKPSMGTSTWTLHVAADTPDALLGDFLLVILGHDRRDPMKYKTKKVGLEVATELPWLLVSNEAVPGMTHLAFRLGDLEAGHTYEIPIEYRYAGKLKRRDGEYLFPRYEVAFLSAPLGVPEPGALAWLGAAAALGLAAARRAPRRRGARGAEAHAVTPAGRRAALAGALCLALAGGRPAAAEDRDAVAFARATALARAGNCGGALAALAELGEATAASAHLRGQCQLAAKDYPAALASLEEAKRRGSASPGHSLQLAVARFQLGDTEGAHEALDAAAPASQQDPEYHLYRGLVLLQQGRSAAAARELARARSLGADVDPAASYYEGLAWVGAAERERANEALARVVESAPGTPWAHEAERVQADLARLAGDRARVWGFLRAGLEVDDNVVLRGHDVFPQDGGQHDVRGVVQLTGGRRLADGSDWAAGVQGTYHGSAHFELDAFDQQYPVLGLWLDRRVGESTLARLRYDVGYAWVDGEPFVFTQELRPSLHHDFGEAGRTELFASLQRTDYLYGVPESPPGPGATDEADARNRDGLGLAAGVEHTLPLRGLATELRGGVSYLRYSARGTEYSYQGVGTWLGTETALPFDVVLRTEIGYAVLPFRHASTYPETVTPALAYENAERKDERWLTEVELEKFLTDALSASLRWTYLDNGSNVAVFDYDREIVGFYLTYRLAR